MTDIATKSINKITFEDVVAFCELKIREHRCLEYKERFSSDKTALKIVKEIAAFANTTGGTLIYGIREEDREPVTPASGARLGEKPRSKVLNACAHSVFPPIVPEISEFLPNPEDPSIGFLVIRVPVTQHVYAVEDGTGIYLRIADQSEPVRASLDQIKSLLLRERTQELQHRKRASMMERLDGAATEGDRRARISMCIGPTLLGEPLCSVEDLIGRYDSYKVRSVYFNKTPFPFEEIRSVRGFTDSIYEAKEYRKHVTAVDVFGNMAFHDRPLRARIVDSLHREEAKNYPSAESGKVFSVDAVTLVVRMFSLLGAELKLLSSFGFVGPVTVHLRADDARHVPIGVDGSGDGLFALAENLTGDTIAFTESTSTLELSETAVLARRVSDRLLWSWGCTDGNALEAVFDQGEMYYFGFDTCTFCSRNKPVTRSRCIRCRREQP